MARRELLTDDERRRIFGVPETEADIIRHYTLSPVDLELTTDRRGSHNRLGFAVQLCLLRHPGFGLRAGESVPEALLSYLAHQLGVMPAAFRDYSRRAQTRLDRGQNKSGAKSYAKGERSMNCAVVRKPRHPIPVDCHRIGPDLISSSARLDNSPGRLVVRGVGRLVKGSFSRLKID